MGMGGSMRKCRRFVCVAVLLDVLRSGRWIPSRFQHTYAATLGSESFFLTSIFVFYPSPFCLRRSIRMGQVNPVATKLLSSAFALDTFYLVVQLNATFTRVFRGYPSSFAILAGKS